MAEIYGMTWETNYGQQDGGMWLVGLQGFTWEDLLHGIEQCLATPSEFPPNLPTFRRYCYRPPVLPAYVRFPRPWANRELVKKSIAECRGILSGKTAAK